MSITHLIALTERLKYYVMVKCYTSDNIILIVNKNVNTSGGLFTNNNNIIVISLLNRIFITNIIHNLCTYALYGHFNM